MTTSLPLEVSVLTDVNVLAIGLTGDHPAYEECHEIIQQALDGPNTLLVSDYHPLRAQYIMTTHFDVPTVEARNAVQSLIQSPAQIVTATDEMILSAYEISAEKDHDVYDCFLIALALAHDTDYLLTADSDFDGLLEDEPIIYQNPISAEKRQSLALVDG